MASANQQENAKMIWQLFCILTLVPIMMKTYITIAMFHIAIRLCSHCYMSRVIGQHNVQVEILFPQKQKFHLHFFLIVDLQVDRIPTYLLFWKWGERPPNL